MSMRTRKPVAAEAGRRKVMLAADRIPAFVVFALGGCYGQPHLLADGTRQEAPNRMRLPAGSFHQFLACYATGSFKQFQNLVSLAAFAGLGGFHGFGRVFWGGGLLGR